MQSVLRFPTFWTVWGSKAGGARKFLFFTAAHTDPVSSSVDTGAVSRG